MKTIVLLVLLTVAVAFYFGYEPYDLVTMFQPKPAAPVKRAHAAAPESTPAAVEVHNVTTVIAPAPDGSLDHRWTTHSNVSASPTGKP